jgi:EF-P lysine aminoacylase GenX
MKTWQKLKKNPSLWQRYFVREKVIQAIREFFLKQHFHEVETPLLVSSVIPESYLEVFETHLLDRNRKKKRMFLTASPEASIKKLLVAGIGNCFEITKSFRNTETDSNLHNPEFTILEWYRVKATYEEIMADCERLLMFIYKKFRNPKPKDSHATINYQGKTIDLSVPWERISVPEALKKYSNVSFNEIAQQSNPMFPMELITRVARKKGYQVTDKNTWEEIFNQIYLNEIEPHLGTEGKPTIIYDYPRPLAALSKIKSSDVRLSERFEFYIAGLELGDCYTELTDYEEQKKRFAEEINTIRQKNKIAVSPDNDFLQTIKAGLPECSGIAVGIDRLVMLFADAANVTEILFFPLEDILK